MTCLTGCARMAHSFARVPPPKKCAVSSLPGSPPRPPCPLSSGHPPVAKRPMTLANAGGRGEPGFPPGVRKPASPRGGNARKGYGQGCPPDSKRPDSADRYGRVTRCPIPAPTQKSADWSPGSCPTAFRATSWLEGATALALTGWTSLTSWAILARPFKRLEFVPTVPILSTGISCIPLAKALKITKYLNY